MSYQAPPANLELGQSLSSAFEVVLQRSGRRLVIDHDRSILSVLLAAGVKAAYSCTRGVCGVCQVNVLSGRPAHRDRVLTREEREAGKIMMVCCSRSMDPLLVLDL